MATNKGSAQIGEFLRKAASDYSRAKSASAFTEPSTRRASKTEMVEKAFETANKRTGTFASKHAKK